MAKNNNPMFRYLLKYVGIYRVKAFYDLDTEDFPRDDNGKLDEDYDGLYIPCKSKSYIVHTYDPEYLMWYCDKLGAGRNVVRALEARRKKIDFTVEETDCEVMITFEAADLPEFAKLVKPMTNGASVKPYSDKNLPKPSYNIPDKDLKQLNNLVDTLPAQDKMLFMRKCVKDFDPIIQKKMGKKYDITKERKKSKLKPKVFIHSIDMWPDFIKFVQAELKTK